jgi:hypothetical protein
MVGIMKLEDVFKRDIASQPKNESGTLSEFFAKRTPKEVAPVIPESTQPPLDESKLEKIKQVYSPQQDRLVSVSELVDTKKIGEQAKELVPEMGWGDVLTSLTPLAVEAIFGGDQAYSVSPGIASQALLSGLEQNKKRRQTLEDKLMELKTIKGTKKGGGLQMKSLVDKETGEKKIGMFDPSGALLDLQGNVLDANKFAVSSGLTEQEFARRQGIQSQQQIKTARELGRDLRADPATGLLGRWEGEKFTPVQVPLGNLNPVQKKDLDATVNAFRASDAYKKPLVTLQAASNVNSLLEQANSNNPIAAEVARSEIAKMAEGGGKLTDQDIERVGGDRSVKGIAKRYINLQKTRMPLTPIDIQELRLVADVLYKVNRLKMMESVGGLEKAIIQKGGVPGSVQTAMLPYIPSSPEFSKTISIPVNKDGKVLMVSPKGKNGFIPKQNVQKALEQGYRIK